MYDNIAILTNTMNNISVEVDADHMRPGKSFDAYIASNRIRMNWNGKVYVGNAHGMEFTSSGPKQIN